MAGKAKLVPKFRGTVKIDYNFIDNLHIFSDMLTALPFGYFNISDTEGSFYSEFEQIQIGASLKFITIADDETLNDIEFKDYVVLGIDQNNGPSNYLGGKITIYFGHKLFLYSDNKNHAYPVMSKDKLVKKVLEDKSRGFKITLKESEETDEPIQHPFYKTCESDWEFLQNKIVPLSAHNDMPMHLFSDIAGNFYFKSFMSMYSKKATYMITPREIMDSNEDKMKFKILISSKNKLKWQGFDRIESSIGGNIYSNEALVKFFVDTLDKQDTASGTKWPVNIAEKASSPKFNNYLPLDNYYMQSDGKVRLLRNKLLGDGLAELISKSRNIDFGISLYATMPLEKDLMLIGNTVEVYIKNGHWANDKWLITGCDIFNQDTDKIMARLKLSRPTFTGDKNETTLKSMVDLFYI